MWDPGWDLGTELRLKTGNLNKVNMPELYFMSLWVSLHIFTWFLVSSYKLMVVNIIYMPKSPKHICLLNLSSEYIWYAPVCLTSQYKAHKPLQTELLTSFTSHSKATPSPVSLVISVTVNVVTQATQGGSHPSPMVFTSFILSITISYSLFL